VAVVLIAGLASLFAARSFFVQECGFDRSEWADAMRVTDQFERYEATDELAERLVECDHLLRGRTKPEVREMLGRPAHRYSRGRVWAYDVGVPEPRSDYSELEVTFGRDGRVRRARIPGFVEP
jgi:hypothetical protein